MRDPRGFLVVTDPHFVDDLYIGKNKFFDKAHKDRDTYFQWFGNSIFLASSDDKWKERRKHLAAAFYKDKMNLLIKVIITIANKKVQEWKRDYGADSANGPNSEMSLTKEVSDLVADTQLGSIFGQKAV